MLRTGIAGRRVTAGVSPGLGWPGPASGGEPLRFAALSPFLAAARFATFPARFATTFLITAFLITAFLAAALSAFLALATAPAGRRTAGEDRSRRQGRARAPEESSTSHGRRSAAAGIVSRL